MIWRGTGDGMNCLLGRYFLKVEEETNGGFLWTVTNQTLDLLIDGGEAPGPDEAQDMAGQWAKRNGVLIEAPDKNRFSRPEVVPERCPFTGRLFILMACRPETRQYVPIYGDTFDSYTIPEQEPDGRWYAYRYFYMSGFWVTDPEVIEKLAEIRRSLFRRVEGGATGK